MNEYRSRSEVIVDLPITEAVSATAGERLRDESTRTETLMTLLADPESSRIALYLPEDWLPTPDQLEYRELYRDAWWKLLNEIDYRADFVDGDIGELDHPGPRPMVVKAAHLIGPLVKNEVIDRYDVKYLHDAARGEIIEQSLADTLQVGTLAVASLADYTTMRTNLEQRVSDPTITPARVKWLYESGVERITRDIARAVDLPLAEQLMATEDTLQLQIALRAFARHGRHGADVAGMTTQIQALRTHDDRLVRRQAEVSLRHLYHAGIVPMNAIDERGLPVLSGMLSENVRFMQPEIVTARRIAERLGTDPVVTSALYPIVILGGSRLKGYGDDTSDVDMAVLVRPGATVPDGVLADVFGNELPKLLPLEMTDGRLHLDPDVSHLLYNALWIGDAHETGRVRSELARGYDDSADRRIALGRLEQDALRYRLMHKGYERHFAIEADDRALPRGGIDRDSTYWDPGYRRLATQIFAERVRLLRKK